MSSAVPIKTKADDYLIELASQTGEEWLKALIGRVLLLRAVPEKESLDEIYEKFLAAHNLKKDEPNKNAPALQATSFQGREAPNGFILKSLQHVEGVNALDAGATISFHPRLTVVYGKNGSGKSGFVRILKRIAGSRTQEEIWQNVYKTRTKNRCKAELGFVAGGSDTVYEWKGDTKVTPFDQMAIFDGKCIPIYLNKTLDFAYQPYAFELFSVLSSSLQGLKERMEADIRSLEKDKPLIDEIFNKETSCGKFVSGMSTATKVEDLKKVAVWDSSSQKALAEKIKERKGLQNLDLQSELLEMRQKKLRALEESLTQARTELSAQKIGEYMGLINRFSQLKKKQTAKKGRTLEDYDIKERNSDEWDRFIEAGEDYIRLAEDEKYPGHDDSCIYCQQKLSKSAEKLIRLYRDLYREEETSEIDKVGEKIDEGLSDIEGLSFADDFPYEKGEFEKILQRRTVSSAFAALQAADILAQKLSACLKSRKPQQLKPLSDSGIITRIRRARTKVENEKRELKEKQRTLLRKSRELDLAIVELQDVQKFSKYRPQLEKYIAIEHWLAKASQLQGRKLNTKPITDLGKRAWRELVSDSFKTQFQQEVADLKAPEVNLEFRGEYGSQVRSMNLEGLIGIDQFLSEGEQKAVALADFFAELSMQSESAPVIFDDPAASFDHERKEKIARRICQEADARQIIVFTHDLMFASYLHDRVEKENGDIDSARAAFHDLQSEAGRTGVVTEDYYPGSVRFDAYIKKVESEVIKLRVAKGETLARGIQSSYGMLRSAIEKAIEERIFGRVIMRWCDQIQLNNVTKASLNRAKLDRAKELHEKFSRYINAHNQSDEMIQHTRLSIPQLEADIQEVRDIAVRNP